MPPKPSQPSMNRHTYLPPHVQQAMDRQMQQTLPAHLKQYTEGNNYIPQHAQQAITEHMERVAPGQFKKYAGSYVQQKVMTQHLALAGAAAQSAPGSAPHGSAPHAVPQDHFHPMPQPLPQPVAPSAPEPIVYAEAPAQQPQQPVPPGQVVPAAPLYPSGQAPAPAEYHSSYDFIVDPASAGEPAKSRLTLPVGTSTPIRAALIAGGLLVLLIIFVFIKGLFSGSSGLTSFVTVAQDQQELIHLATNAGLQKGLATSNQNFAATAQLSLGSGQAAIVQYLANNGQKVGSKALNLKVSTAIDNQLTAAAAATTYDQTYQQINQNQLNVYSNDLKLAFQQTKSIQGHVLLSNEYKQAQLLLVQANAPITTQ